MPKLFWGSGRCSIESGYRNNSAIDSECRDNHDFIRVDGLVSATVVNIAAVLGAGDYDPNIVDNAVKTSPVA